jgi:hypothetical protein
VVPLQVPVSHGVPLVQQGSPEPPQRVHVGVPVAVEQTVLRLVHVLPGQQGSRSSPQRLHEPLLPHTSEPFSQVAPTATHWSATKSQHPAVHVSPGQQAPPGWPQLVHVEPLHTWVPPPHVSPCTTHVLVVESQQPSLQTSPVQHASPA